MTDSLVLGGLTVERGGRPVVKDVTITVPAGQVTAVLGPNGAGKSSMVLAVGGVLRPRPGSVLMNGIELAGRRPEKIRAAGVAIVPEGRRLLPDLTVEDNFRVATFALSKQAATQGRARALELFPALERRLNVPARSLSGGEQQMVVLAQALVSAPKYLLIDELSLGLAPVVVNRLVPVIRAATESGIGVLLIEQFATLALGLATSAYVMEGGAVRYSGTASELRDNPDLLHSAYLLRGSQPARDQVGAPGTPPSQLSRTNPVTTGACSRTGKGAQRPWQHPLRPPGRAVHPRQALPALERHAGLKDPAALMRAYIVVRHTAAHLLRWPRKPVTSLYADQAG